MSDTHQLKRGLKNRHVQLLAIGGAIGTGLFLGSGRAIHLAGWPLYTSDAADELLCVELGGRGNNKTKTVHATHSNKEQRVTTDEHSHEYFKC